MKEVHLLFSGSHHSSPTALVSLAAGKLGDLRPCSATHLQSKHTNHSYPLFGMLAEKVWVHSKIEWSESIDGISS